MGNFFPSGGTIGAGEKPEWPVSIFTLKYERPTLFTCSESIQLEVCTLADAVSLTRGTVFDTVRSGRARH